MRRILLLALVLFLLPLGSAAATQESPGGSPVIELTNPAPLPEPAPSPAAVDPDRPGAPPLPDVLATVLSSPQFADLVQRVAEDTGDPWPARIGIGTSGVVLGLLVGALLWR